MDKERVNEKLVYLNEILFELEGLAQIDKKEFLMSKIYFSALENYLRKALQIIIDLAEDTVSKKRLRAMFIILWMLWSFSEKPDYFQRKIYRYIKKWLEWEIRLSMIMREYQKKYYIWYYMKI